MKVITTEVRKKKACINYELRGQGEERGKRGIATRGQKHL